MSINGKLFGSIGQPQTASVPASETAAPGYAAWCSQKIAQSYEARRQRRASNVVQLFQAAPRLLQMAA